jgi:predicted nucleic acid-binding protein
VIVVDTTVRIDFLSGRNLPHVKRLRRLLGGSEIIIGDLMLCVILHGSANERAARDVEAPLRRFDIVSMAGDAIAAAAARNFRALRSGGVTIRTTIDPLIGTWCTENHVPLLHNDRDFHPVGRDLGLAEVAVLS